MRRYPFVHPHVVASTNPVPSSSTKKHINPTTYDSDTHLPTDDVPILKEGAFPKEGRSCSLARASLVNPRRLPPHQSGAAAGPASTPVNNRRPNESQRPLVNGTPGRYEESMGRGSPVRPDSSGQSVNPANCANLRALRGSSPNQHLAQRYPSTKGSRMSQTNVPAGRGSPHISPIPLSSLPILDSANSPSSSQPRPTSSKCTPVSSPLHALQQRPPAAENSMAKGMTLRRRGASVNSRPVTSTTSTTRSQPDGARTPSYPSYPVDFVEEYIVEKRSDDRMSKATVYSSSYPLSCDSNVQLADLTSLLEICQSEKSELQRQNVRVMAELEKSKAEIRRLRILLDTPRVKLTEMLDLANKKVKIYESLASTTCTAARALIQNFKEAALGDVNGEAGKLATVLRAMEEQHGGPRFPSPPPSEREKSNSFHSVRQPNGSYRRRQTGQSPPLTHEPVEGNKLPDDPSKIRSSTSQRHRSYTQSMWKKPTADPTMIRRTKSQRNFITSFGVTSPSAAAAASDGREVFNALTPTDHLHCALDGLKALNETKIRGDKSSEKSHSRKATDGSTSLKATLSHDSITPTSVLDGEPHEMNENRGMKNKISTAECSTQQPFNHSQSPSSPEPRKLRGTDELEAPISSHEPPHYSTSFSSRKDADENASICVPPDRVLPPPGNSGNNLPTSPPPPPPALIPPCTHSTSPLSVVSSIASSSSYFDSSSDIDSDDLDKPPPPPPPNPRMSRVPLLGLAKHAVGAGAWLGGEETRGDTYFE